MADETMRPADLGPSKRAATIAAGFMLLVLVAISILLHTDAKHWLDEHSLLHSLFIDGPAVALAVIAFGELRHSGEANEDRKKANAFRDEANALRNQANELQNEANRLRRQNLALTEQLGAEQNKNLRLIAEYTKPVATKAQKNAAVLRKYMRQMASVSLHGPKYGAVPLEIVEVTDDDSVTLFSRTGPNSTSAYYAKIDCGELMVDETPPGSCPVRINVLNYHGQTVDLGQITKWEDRHQAAAASPSIEKRQMSWHASYTKGGSAETRTLLISQSRDGSNRFQLEANPGGTFVGDNVQVSKQRMSQQVEYFADGFHRGNSGSGEVRGGYSLYIL